ncbi:hypothetical protein ACIQXG_22575 [Lysinibacillus sphaericus]
MQECEKVTFIILIKLLYLILWFINGSVRAKGFDFLSALADLRCAAA